MNSEPAPAELLDEVRARGSVTVEALAEQLGVTLQTVRRDVKLLADAGLLARFHGGVRVPSSTTENIAYRQRQHAERSRPSSASPARWPRRCRTGCSLIINIGTTTEAIARELLHHTGLRVITNNLNVAAILSDNPDCEVIVAGGIVRSRDRGIVGEATVDFIRQFKVDIGLIGISGIEADGTLRDFDYREVKVARAIIEHSREVWLAADHSKFNRPAMVELARLDADRPLFTDAAPPAPFPALLAEAGVTLRHLRGDAMTDAKTLPARPRPGHLELAQHRLRRATAASSRWRSASSARSIRSRAGSSTTRRRSGSSQLATAREALAKAGARRPATSPRSASPTSARPRCVWNRSDRRADRTTPSSGRTGAPRRRCAALRERGLEPLFREQDRPGPRRLLLRHQARLAARPRARRARRGRARRARLRHRRQLADVAADRRRASTPPTSATPRARCCSTCARNDVGRRAAGGCSTSRATLLPEVHAVEPRLRPTPRPTCSARRSPIGGVAGDQQSALFGQACFAPGHGEEHLRHRLLHADAHRRAFRDLGQRPDHDQRRAGRRARRSSRSKAASSSAARSCSGCATACSAIKAQRRGAGARRERARHRRRDVRAGLHRPRRAATGTPTRAAPSSA